MIEIFYILFAIIQIDISQYLNDKKIVDFKFLDNSLHFKKFDIKNKLDSYVQQLLYSGIQKFFFVDSGKCINILDII